MVAPAAAGRRSLRPSALWAPLTARARTLFVAGVVLLVAGLALGIIDLVRIGVFAAALPVVAVLVVTRARLRIACGRHNDPPVAVAGGAVEVVLTLTNRSIVPTGPLHLEDVMPAHLAGQARFTLAGLGPQVSRSVVYRLSDVRRGRYVTGPLRIRIDDAFGLVDVVRSFAGRSEFLVTPRVELLSAPGPTVTWDVGDDGGSRSVGSHGAEDASIREYRYGDDLRRIHWRSTARTGTPMVRQDERPWQGRVTVVLDNRRAAHAAVPSATPDETDELDGAAGAHPAGGAGDGIDPATDVRRRDSFEWAVSAAASVAGRMLASGRDTGLLYETAGAGPAPVRLPVASGREVAEHLADLLPSSRTDLGRLLAEVRVAARDSVVVAVLGELDRASVEGLAALAAATPRAGAGLLAVLVDVPGWRGRTPHPEPAAVARLRAAGWGVAVAHRGEDVGTVWDRLLTRGRGAGAVPGAGTAVDAVRTTGAAR